MFVVLIPTKRLSVQRQPQETLDFLSFLQKRQLSEFVFAGGNTFSIKL